MRAVVQRVSSASVAIDGTTVGQIDRGLVILLGISQTDAYEDLRYLADKIAVLRIFDDEHGKMNLSAQDIGAEMLVISQFTLYADCRKGRRPSFTDAAEPKVASALYDMFIQYLMELGFEVQTGEFGARMLVHIHNDGPVSIILDSDDRKARG